MFKQYLESEWLNAKAVKAYEQPSDGICSTLVDQIQARR